MNERIVLAEKRYWPKVIKSDGCWEWAASRGKYGHGQFYLDGRMMRATHFAIILEGSDVPSGMQVCHHCDNPPCVNPDHLFIGTQADNNRDRHQKGRTFIHSKEQFQRMQLLTARKRRMFTDDQIRYIRNCDLTGAELATKHGVNPSTISFIRRRKTYVDVE